ADQSNGSGTPAYNVTFGNANGTQDIAQSFQISISEPLNKVQFYIKKVSTPSNATVKIMNDSSGSPGTTVFASGTLPASTVTTLYGWVDVSFTSNPLLNVGTTYWIVLDTGTSSSKYYITGATNATYADGIGKIGQQGSTWNNTSPSGLDYYFSVYLGGINGLIAGSSGSQWNQLSIGTSGTGTAQAHTINYTEAPGLLYCQTGTGNNKACTIQADPTYIAPPISDANIAQWKVDATAGGTYSGTYNTPGYGDSTLGPKKITGNLNVTGSHTLYLTGTVWVQGNVTVDGAAKIVLDSSYGHGSGLLVADGWLNLAGSGQLNGTGQTGSYLLFVTTSDSTAVNCSGTGSTICISGAAGSVILNAQKGTLVFTGSASAKEASAYKMFLTGNTRVNYESGLANLNFNSGPSGTWDIASWKESQ
ncbi:MAG: choice-of-anchor R domain-containing protein, partial [archaeon]